LYIFEALYLV